MDGLLDTNVFLHAHTTDAFAEECTRFLTTLEEGRRYAYLADAVVHELSFAWSHYFKSATKQEIAAFLLTVLTWPGVVANNRARLIGAVRRWRDGNLGFVDALLSEQAQAEDRVVYTKNVRDFLAQSVVVPDPLPH